MPRKKRAKTAAKTKSQATVSRRRVDVRLTDHEAQRIEQIVAQGHYFSKADFARAAVREKLGALPVPHEQAKTST